MSDKRAAQEKPSEEPPERLSGWCLNGRHGRCERSATRRPWGCVCECHLYPPPPPSPEWLQGFEAAKEMAAKEVSGECHCRSMSYPSDSRVVGQEHWGSCPIFVQQRIRALEPPAKESR